MTTLLQDILPARIAWVKAPAPGDMPLDLPDCRIYWWRESTRGVIFLLVESEKLAIIDEPDDIPILEPQWVHTPPQVRWVEVGK